MQILIAPGAFKHSLGAGQAAEAIRKGLAEALPSATLHLLPIADGGNGTLDAWLAQGGERYSLTVHDPLLRPIEAEYGMLPDKRTAIIEMATASGIELLSSAERDPLTATSYGTGELLQAALEKGARRFIIGMGGSATVDGGSGALCALGVKLLDANNKEIPQGGGYLTQIVSIDSSGLDPRWGECEIIIASDVENTLLGETGASTVFAPQKGASADDVMTLEANLAHFADMLVAHGCPDIRDVIGTGAAGGLSAGLMAFIGGEILSGIDLLLDYNQFEDALQKADLVITGEGQMDEQTVFGKGPIGVARLAQTYNIPTIALVGGLNVHDRILHDAGINAVFSVVDKPMSLENAIGNAEVLLERAALRVGYMLKMMSV
ncbi:MAG: glycerate kinase [Phototrophicaceae bacterium]